MSSISLSLIVIKSACVLKLKNFYEALGLVFQKEQHGDGGGLVLEIYPVSKNQLPTLCRLGFTVDNIARCISRLPSETVFIKKLSQENLGVYFVEFKDPEGRIIAINQKPA